MLNSSLNRRPVSAALMIVICCVAVVIFLPLATIGNPSPTVQDVKVTPPPLPAPPLPPSRFALPPAAPPPPPPLPPLPATSPQTEFGSLSGTAYDPSGAVIPGVTVVATNLQTRAGQTTTNNAAGDYAFQQLPAGDYSLQADFPGFATSRIARIAIGANQNVKQNVNLIVGNISESVVVMAQGPPKPATLLPAGTPRRIRVGGNVTSARMINQVRPIYPPTALNAGVEGTVSLQTIIGTDGSVQALRVLSSIDADLTAAALEAVKQWRYSPTLLNGVPVEILSNVDVQFKLPQQ
jgi:TonB family protein